MVREGQKVGKRSVARRKDCRMVKKSLKWKMKQETYAKTKQSTQKKPTKNGGERDRGCFGELKEV